MNTFQRKNSDSTQDVYYKKFYPRYEQDHTFAFFDNLTCVNNRYLLGSQRIKTAKKKWTEIFLLDLTRNNKEKSEMAVASSAEGFGTFMNGLAMDVPNFRDQADLVSVKDVENATAHAVQGEGHITGLFFAKDTTVYAATAVVDAEGVGTSDRLQLRTIKVDKNYQKGDRYYATSFYPSAQNDGTFYLAKKKIGSQNPILLSCQSTADNLDCKYRGKYRGFKVFIDSTRCFGEVELR